MGRMDWMRAKMWKTWMGEAGHEREHWANIVIYRNEYLNSKPGRETAEGQEMDSVTS